MTQPTRIFWFATFGVALLLSPIRSTAQSGNHPMAIHDGVDGASEFASAPGGPLAPQGDEPAAS